MTAEIGRIDVYRCYQCGGEMVTQCCGVGVLPAWHKCLLRNGGAICGGASRCLTIGPPLTRGEPDFFFAVPEPGQESPARTVDGRPSNLLKLHAIE